METPLKTGRDPVCESIESLLSDLQAQGKGSFVRTEKEGRVRLAFGDIHAEAETDEIALVRLASAMMDDRRYMLAVMEALRGQMVVGIP